ncbi:MAG TPA: ABC transporter ATP-binding protein [Actinomycetota bacterium]|nr:ABC transporter ATP-binding protein [Actinomycetota bacterium]
MALLETRALRTGYEGIPVVFGIDMEVNEGEVVALLGSNGAGKTTTLRAISGMIKPFSGDISFNGKHIGGVAPEKIARAGLIHVPQGRGIFPSLGVEESLRLAAAMAKVPRGELQAGLDEAYALFPRLRERRTQAAGTLSGGEQQMLTLARGLISRPKLLMIDEMSQGLAPSLVAELFEIVAKFPDRGLSVLLVEQFVGQALAVAQRAYVLKKGEIEYEGSASKLAKDEDFVRASYLGESGEAAAPEAEPAREEAPAPVTAAQIYEKVSISLPPALVRGLEERAAREGLDPDEFVRKVVEGNIDELVGANSGNGKTSGNGSADGAKPKKKRTIGGRRRASS